MQFGVLFLTYSLYRSEGIGYIVSRGFCQLRVLPMWHTVPNSLLPPLNSYNVNVATRKNQHIFCPESGDGEVYVEEQAKYGGPVTRVSFSGLYNDQSCEGRSAA